MKGKIVGIYEIVLLRTEWGEQVDTQTYLVAGGIVLLLVIYGAIIYFLNRLIKSSSERAYASNEGIC